jgi:predicted SAM-dependent methyltransferase
MRNPIPERQVTLQDRVELAIKHSLRHLGIDISRVRPPTASETSQSRPRLSDYCRGNGVDLGPGGDPISPSAVRVDLPVPYTEVGSLPVQLSGDARDLYWFRDQCLDYVYSSHLLEDFEDTEQVLREWIRVLKIGGKLVIYCPDEQKYRAHCTKTGQGYNYNHIHETFSLKMVKDIIIQIGNCKIIHEGENIGDYCWEIVAERAR